MTAKWMVLLFFQITPEVRQHVEAGLAAKRSGDLDGAAREFVRVTELAPGLAAAFVNLGAVYYEKSDFARAVAPLEQALKLNPDLPGAEGMLGLSLLATGYARESIVHLDKGGQVDTLGVALLEAGRPREAIDKLEAALEKRPGDPDLLYYLGQAHNRLSRQAFDMVLKAAPDSARAEELLGEANLETGHADVAQKHFQAALRTRPDLLGVHLSLGEIALEAGDYASAEKEFGREAARFPGSAAAAYKHGVALLNMGRGGEALAELRRADRLLPEMPETLLELGKAESAGGETAAAEKHLLRVVELEPESRWAGTAHFQLAQLYRKSGRRAEAEGELKRFQDLRK